MTNNYLITGYWGEPHVTAENDRGINAAMFGAGRFVLPVGEQFKAEYIGNNTIRLHDGKLMDNGAAAGIPVGEYVDLLIANAGQGMNRNDLIVFQYSQDVSTLIERGKFIVVQGEETTGTAVDPALTQSDLLSGKATLDQMAMWRVSVSGTVISTPVQLFDVSKNMKTAGVTVAEATSNDGVAYSATAPGVSELYAGLEIIIIPQLESESETITLNVNGLGAKNVRLPLSSNTTTLVMPEQPNYYTAGRPVKLRYDATWLNKGAWVVAERQRTSGNDLYGSVPVQKGGWVVDNNTTDEDKAEALESLLAMGLAPSGDYATKNYVSTQIAQAKLDGQNVDLSGFATKDDLGKLTPASIGAAPSGYGLGEAVLISMATIDNQAKPGWYYANESAKVAGFSSNRWWLHVKAYGAGSTFATQELYSFTGSLSVKLERHKINGTWGEWAWRDPIMNPGTEYLTTEHWNGKPVYAKLLVWTSTTAMNYEGRYEVPHGISNLDSASLRVEWTTEEWTLPHVSTTEALYISGVDSAKNSSKLIVKTSGNATWDAGRTFYFHMKYCKA